MNHHKCQEIVWKILPSDQGEDDTPWHWIHESDLETISKTLSSAARAKLERADTSSSILVHQDPINAGTLSFVPVRGGYSELHRDPREPCGVRLRLSDGEETIVLFTAYNVNIGPRLLITYVHNLRPSDLPSLLRVLDTIGNNAGRIEGWIWDLDPSSDLVQAWRAIPERVAQVGRRPVDSDGHLLGVAWYGSEEEAGSAELVDGQMWSWC